jgi:DNA-binding CsgD family transcriptional regulator
MAAAVVRDFPDLFATFAGFAIVSAGRPLGDLEGPAALARMLESSAAGRGAGLFVAGEPGSGKTALLQAARRENRATFRVGWGQADRVEATVPFGVFSQAFRGVASPDLHDPTDRMLEAFQTSRAEAFRLALCYLESAAVLQPVLIILDDLHCADPESLALLTFLWRRIDAIAVGILGSCRLWPGAAIDMARRLPGGEDAILRLPRLDANRLDALVKARNGNGPMHVDTAGILDQSQGNPYLVHQLLVHHRKSRSLDGRFEDWRRTDLRELVSRFVGESEDLRMVAAAASIFGNDFRPALAVRTAKLDAGAARDGLEALFQSGLFLPSAHGGARFAHPLVRSAVYATLGPTLRAQLHASAMRALLDHGARVVEAAEHAMLAEAAGDPSAVEVLAEAAQAALAVGDLAGARRYLEGGVAMAANGVRPRLMFMLGQVLLATGEHGAALSLFRGLGSARSGSNDATLARRWAARAQFARGNTEEAESELRAAARGAEIAGDACALGRARIDQAAMALYTRGPAAALELATAASKVVQGADRRLVAAAGAILACCGYATGDPSGLSMVESMTRELARNPIDDIGPLTWGWGVLGVCFQTAQTAELFSEAETAFNALYEFAQTLELPVAVAALATARADHLLHMGRIDDALAMSQVAVSCAGRAPGLVIWADAVRAEVLFESGQTSAGAERLQRAMDQLAKPGAPALPSAFVHHLAAVYELDGRRPARASELFELVELEIEAAGVVDPSAIPWGPPAIAAHLAAGRPDSAKRVQCWLERGAAALPARRPRAMAAVGRAALADAEGDAGAAESALQDALAILDQLPMKLATVEALIAQGRLLRIQGRVRAARALLVRGVELAHAAGAVRLEALCRQEMSISGGRFRQHRDPLHLTPQETRVAALARQGLSDRDIGRKLFISQKTVETHLMRVYRKMDVGNRRELMLRPV